MHVHMHIHIHHAWLIISCGRQRRQDGEETARKKKDGYVDIPRRKFRELEGNAAIVNGNAHSCSQDALVNGAKALGIAITKAQVYDETLPLQGDTSMSVIVDYARDIGIGMLDCRVPGTTSTPETVFRTRGGPKHALLQITARVFFVEVGISHAALMLKFCSCCRSLFHNP